MKNSKLTLRVFIFLVLLTGWIIVFITMPFVLLFIAVAILIIGIIISILEKVEENYAVFGRKYNIFYQIGKFLDSFPQIIKDKK